MRRIALRRVQDELLGVRFWLYLLGGVFVLGALLPDEDEPMSAWKRALTALIGAALLLMARGLFRARPWARYTSAALCLAPAVLGFPQSLLSPFALLALASGVYLLLPQTAAHFRRAQSKP